MTNEEVVANRLGLSLAELASELDLSLAQLERMTRPRLEGLIQVLKEGKEIARRNADLSAEFFERNRKVQAYVADEFLVHWRAHGAPSAVERLLALADDAAPMVQVALLRDLLCRLAPFLRLPGDGDAL